MIEGYEIHVDGKLVYLCTDRAKFRQVAPKYARYGNVEFRLAGKPLKLTEVTK